MNKKLTKMFVTILSAAVLATLLCACGPTEAQLNAYDDDSIIAKRDTSYMVKNVSNTTTSESKYDFDYFCGVKTLSTVSMDGEKTFSVDLTIYDNDFKFVLVKGDEVIILCDQSTEGEITKTEIMEQNDKTDISGDYKLKMVGRAAKAQFDIKF